MNDTHYNLHHHVRLWNQFYLGSNILCGIIEYLQNSPIKHSFMFANYVANRHAESSPILTLIARESNRPPGHAAQLLLVKSNHRLDLRGMHRGL